VHAHSQGWKAEADSCSLLLTARVMRADRIPA
jgi:hypothetical protein